MLILHKSLFQLYLFQSLFQTLITKLSSNTEHVNRDKLRILRYILLDSYKFLISFEKYFNTQKINYFLRYRMHQ